MFNVKGSIVALITPFHEDGSVNFEKLGEILEFHAASQTDAILILGSGSNCTETAIEKSVKYDKMGADALLVISPYYNKTNTQGMIHHFTAVADAVDKPVIIYNVPGRTGCNISEEAVRVLSKHPNICGIKEASGNIAYATAIARYLSDDFVMYSGNDDMIVPLLSLGAIGVISVWANIMPKEVHQLVMDYLNGSQKKALETQLRYLNLVHALFIEVNPIPVKEAMNLMGMNVGGFRAPLFAMDEHHRQTLAAAMKEAGL